MERRSSGRRGEGLTAKQRLFCEAYMANGHNATQAAIAAGYSANVAHQQGHENLRKPEIAAWLAERMEKRATQLELTALRLDQELARIAFLDPARLMNTGTGTVLALKDMPEDVRRAVRSVKVQEIWAGEGEARKQIGQVVEVKLEPKVEALRLAYERRALIDLELRLATIEGDARRPS